MAVLEIPICQTTVTAVETSPATLYTVGTAVTTLTITDISVSNAYSAALTATLKVNDRNIIPPSHSIAAYDGITKSCHIVISAGSTIKGGASTASKVDFILSGYTT